MLKPLRRNIYNMVNFLSKKLFSSQSALCRIEEIDLVKNYIIIHCRGIEAPIKLSFDEIINDTVLLSNLSSKQASWIGYYYGKYYGELLSKTNNSSVPANFSFNITRGKNHIKMITRQGHLIFSDNETKISYTLSPITIMSDKELIKRFEPIQACYIGILSALSNVKPTTENSLSFSKSAQLKLVK